MKPTIDAMTEIKEIIRARAQAFGFDAVGFTLAKPVPTTLAIYDNIWPKAAMAMDWMARNAERRADPQAVGRGKEASSASALTTVRHRMRWRCVRSRTVARSACTRAAAIITTCSRSG